MINNKNNKQSLVTFISFTISNPLTIKCIVCNSFCSICLFYRLVKKTFTKLHGPICLL